MVGSGQKKILVVDDENINRKVVSAMLQAFGHDCIVASSGAQGLEMFSSDVDLVLLDVMMPGMDGFQVAEALRARDDGKDVPIIMITALSDKEDRLQAVRAGASDFIAKPIDATELKLRMQSLLKIKEYHDEIKQYKTMLEGMVEAKTKALKIALSNLHVAQKTTIKAHLETLNRLSAAAEFKDEDTAQHIQRMSRYSALLAQKYGLPDEQVDLVLNASPMHDIGKIGVPDTILRKPGKLTAEEWEIMQRHCEIGAKILDSTSSHYLSAGRDIAMTHHEKWDGSGYPRGLKGEDIPLFGRICAVADVFDALTSVRPYKPAYSREKALRIMGEGRGTHFQPELLDIFFDVQDEVRLIQSEWAN